ncbi:peptidoglycan endopeptidase [Pseudoflavonifractor sp. 524-17]|uniref:C40 family peptidase n=1 Tax=Pseudoflavonifractor sp. 524-17 TaxID=2304577 RepID=UPI00137972D4|nr:NlpC/P60 family protein [Pseudoflavonifractor sp. 524-17]NCE63364.1 peptidoglycan endopeptidase [Pseudoflavonifractor sp. 524-17]
MNRKYASHRAASALTPVMLFWVLVLLLCPLLLARPHPGTPERPLPTFSPQAAALVDALPQGLSPARQAACENACRLVGQVGYFWGGKSTALGWDLRWGQYQTVTALGSDDTGRRMPFGLDCSGFITWLAVNALGGPAGASLVGDGARNQYAACTPISWEELQPGDLVFFPDLSHVGLALGQDGDGVVTAVHCSRSLGGVVLSQDAAQTGFSLAARPPWPE